MNTAQNDNTEPLAIQKPNILVRFKNQIFKGGKALRHRNYRLFWTGQLVSLIGTWMQTVAQAWLVLTLSDNDPLALGLISVAQFLPTTLFSLFTGVLADRYSKYKIIIITQITAMLLAITLGVLTATGAVQLWHIYLCAAGLGIVNAFDMPTRQSFVPEMVGKEDLMNAVALNSTIFNGARVAGPAVAGLLIGVGERIFNSTLAGVSLAVWLNALSYVAVLIGLSRIKTAELHLSQKPLNQGTVFSNLKEGLLYIKNTPTVLSLIMIIGMVGTFGFNFNVWIPVLSREYLKVGAEGYGILMGGFGFGAFAGALWLAMSSKQPELRRIMTAVAFFGAFLMLVGVSGIYFVSLALMVCAGLAMIRANASSNTLIQMTTPDHLRGRVMSVYLLVFAGTAPLGSLFMGGLGNWLGTPVSMLIGGLMVMLSVPLVLLYRRAVANRAAAAADAKLETAEPVRVR
jgi:MFS family permease